MKNLLLQATHFWLGQLSSRVWAANFREPWAIPHRDQELEGTLKLHEFMRRLRTRLQNWLASQKQVAGGGESLGEDYEDVLVRRGWGRAWLGCVKGFMSPG